MEYPEYSRAQPGVSNAEFSDREHIVKPWYSTSPRDGLLARVEPTTQRRRTGVRKLSDICADQVAANYDDIYSPLLGVLGWNQIWKHVWSTLCKRGYDSCRLFMLFLKHFGTERDFRCHHHQSGSKHTSVDVARLVSRQHRVVHVPMDGPLSPVIADILDLQATKAFRFVVSLNLSGINIRSSEFMTLMSFKCLKALDIGGTSAEPIPEGVLSMWVRAMNDQWKRLKVLCLGRRLKVSGRGLQEIFQCDNLDYIETTGIETSQGWREGKEVRGFMTDFTSRYSLAQKTRFVEKLNNAERQRRAYLIEIIKPYSTGSKSSVPCFFRSRDPSIPSAQLSEKQPVQHVPKRPVVKDYKQVKKKKLRTVGFDPSGQFVL